MLGRNTSAIIINILAGHDGALKFRMYFLDEIVLYCLCTYRTALECHLAMLEH